jgi:hypothetical protein
MQIHLSRNGVQLGVFTEAEIRAKLANGEISAADVAWREGMSDWQPLGSVMGGQPGVRPAAPSSGVQTTSGMAIASLVCSLLCITALPGVILGHIALSKIKNSDGALGGRGLAIAGLVIGYMLLAINGVAILASLAVPTYNRITSQANQMKAAANCRQIQGLLLSYAADNNGLYPDSVTNPVTGQVPGTSNEAFRALFQEGLTQEEKIFGAPASRYNPDNNIGTAPVFAQALTPGENHWAMTQGLQNSSSSQTPLVFEAPAEASWPPKWDADAGGRPMRGRAWPGGKIVIGRNDGSVETMRLESTKGLSTVRPASDGTPVFPTDGGEKVLDIAP